MLLQNLFSKTKRMHVYNLQTETSNIFLFVSEELEKTEREKPEKEVEISTVNKNENIQANT